MADGKDTGRFDSPEDFDFDATVQLNIGKHGNIVSSVTSSEITPDDFEKTIDGILGINEALETMPQNNADMKTVSLSSDELDFDEIDAGLNALSEETKGTPAKPNTETAGVPLSPKKEKSFKGMPLLGEEDADNGIGKLDDFDLPAEGTSGDDGEMPVFELTENLLVAPDEPEFPGTVKLPSSEAGGGPLSETPDLTATEKHILSGATAAIRELSDDDDLMGGDTFQPPFAAASQPPAKGKGNSSVFAVLLGLIGITVGGFGAWLAFEATNQIEDLKRQIQSLSPSLMTKKNQEIADIQQRLAKIERRLTGTPTIEAAAPLMSAGNEATANEKASTAKSVEPIVKPITPQTRVSTPRPDKPAATTSKSGEWVINLSSHTTEAQALKEQARLQKLGLNADISTATVKDRTWYRIRINNFATMDEAKAQLKDVQDRSGVKDAWISRK